MLAAVQTLTGLASQLLPGNSNAAEGGVSSALPLWGLQGNASAANGTDAAILTDTCTLQLPASDFAILLAFSLLQQMSAPGCIITLESMVAPVQAVALLAGGQGHKAATMCRGKTLLAAGIKEFKVGGIVTSGQQSLLLTAYSGCSVLGAAFAPSMQQSRSAVPCLHAGGA